MRPPADRYWSSHSVARRVQATPKVIRAVPVTRQSHARRARRDLTPEVALVLGIIIGVLAGLATAPLHW